MKNIIRAALYCRFSSDKQNESSIEAQLFAGREHCKKKGYAIVEEYVDQAESARSDERTNYRRLLNDAKCKKFDIAIFHKIDRNARNEVDYYHTKSLFAKHGVAIEYSGQQFAETPEGRMLEGVMVNLAAYYSRNLAQETLKTLRLKARNSEFTGGVAPFGYDIVDKKYVINEREAIAVRKIFEMRTLGYGYGEMAQWLSDNGYTTKRGTLFKKTSLHDLLKNEKYVGNFVYGKTQKNLDGIRSENIDESKVVRCDGSIPAIVDQDTWTKVQNSIRNNVRRNGSYRAKRVYLLSGKIKCAECGASMIGKTTRRTDYKDGEYSRYYCPNHEGGNKDCPNLSIRLDLIEDFIIDFVKKFLSSAKAQNKIAAEIVAAADKVLNTGKDTIKKLEKSTADKKTAVDNLYKVLMSTGRPMDEFDISALSKAKADYAKSKQLLDDALRKKDLVAITEASLKQFINDFVFKNKKEPDLSRAIISTFLHRVSISTTAVEVDLVFNTDPVWLVHEAASNTNKFVFYKTCFVQIVDRIAN